MKNLKSRYFILSFILSFVSITAMSQSFDEFKKSAASPRPITTNIVWQNLTKTQVYNNALVALHLQGYELEPLLTSRESGLIITKSVGFYPPIWHDKWLGGEYLLNILVYENGPDKVSINIQVNGTKLYDYQNEKGEYKRTEFQHGDDKRIVGDFRTANLWNGLTIKVSDDIDRLIQRLESIQGKAITKNTTTKTWE
jgi:hypothetical protein